MEADSVDAAAEWDVVPAGRGHDGLRDLAADGFSGGVTDGRVWAMLTNGRVVGVHGGEMADLADADLTAHEAPDPALPLLLVMRERSGAPRAQYYTEETPLTEVDATLRRGGFTGYVELSENVLSGDYYLVYYGGDRMPVAFIGGSRRLETGEEAFDRATGEVGIYDVHDVDVSVVDVPGGEETTAAGAVVGEERDGVDETDETGDDTDGTHLSTASVEFDDDTTATDADGEPGDGVSDPTADDEHAEATEGSVEDDATTDDEAGAASASGEAFDDTGVDDAGPAREHGDEPDDGERTEATDGPDAETTEEGATATTTESGTETTEPAVEERLAALRAERDELEERVETLTAEREDLREEVERLRREVERVENERAALRERLESSGAGAAGGQALSAAAALSGTSLFVRYRSKAEPTLEGALDDGEAHEAVDENLLLERHTTFEAEGATVDGEPYGEFLPATLQYRFVEWLVRALPFELRDAAGKRPLGRLYKAIPSFDRAEIDGSVTVRTDEGDEERTFDVVMRDRKGSPLAVASLFDGREPATEAMLSELVEDARAAAAANESLGAAVFVTTSYYAPEALELAEDETSGGGLFGRGSRESYVRLDRSHGFHLCLVEARDDDFHLGVPDL